MRELWRKTAGLFWEWRACLVVLSGLVLFECVCVSESQQKLAEPILTSDLSRFGYHEIKVGSVMSFFGDVDAHIAVLSDDVAVIYRTIPDKLKMGDWPGTMTAYFIDLKNGSLIRTQQWRTRARRNLMETKESEARIYPLSGSRYVVMAGGILYLYDARGNQLFEKTLAVGMWSMQPVSGGNELVLRYEKAQQKISSDGISRDVEYSWLDSHDMTVQATLKDRDFDRSQTGMTASGRLLIYPDSNGLHTLSISNVDRLVCTEEYCKEPVLDEVEATAYGLAVGSRMGFGVIPMSNKSKSWFLSVWPNGDLDRITVLPIVTSPEAQTLAAYVARGKKYRMFDGEKLSLDEELFVYRTADGKRLAIVPGADCAFSPDGSKLVSFDGRDLRLYAIDASD